MSVLAFYLQAGIITCRCQADNRPHEGLMNVKSRNNDRMPS
jgi:hypothetical protein